MKQITRWLAKWGLRLHILAARALHLLIWPFRFVDRIAGYPAYGQEITNSRDDPKKLEAVIDSLLEHLSRTSTNVRYELAAVGAFAFFIYASDLFSGSRTEVADFLVITIFVLTIFLCNFLSLAILQNCISQIALAKFGVGRGEADAIKKVADIAELGHQGTWLNFCARIAIVLVAVSILVQIISSLRPN